MQAQVLYNALVDMAEVRQQEDTRCSRVKSYGYFLAL